MTERIIYECDECPHVFSFEDIQREREQEAWGHPCFQRGAQRCESYRACFRLVRIVSPITEDSYPSQEARHE